MLTIGKGKTFLLSNRLILIFLFSIIIERSKNHAQEIVILKLLLFSKEETWVMRGETPSISV